MTDDLVKWLRELGEHPCRSELPMGVGLRQAATVLEALEAENERLREAVEQFLVLIKHQYFGSREAMNDLQEADNAARAALGDTK